MPNLQSVTFQEALDIIESLPEYQQEDIIDIVRHRLIDQKRELITKNIKKARLGYAHGEVKEGTVDELMIEIGGKEVEE